jgi:hypothetical protein
MGNQFAAPSGVVNPVQQLFNTTLDKIKRTGMPKMPPNSSPAAAVNNVSGLKTGIAGAVLTPLFNTYAMPQAHALGRNLGLGEGGLLRNMFSEQEQLKFDAKRKNLTFDQPPAPRIEKMKDGKYLNLTTGMEIDPASFKTTSKPADSTRTNANGVVQHEHGSGITARSISEINSDLGIDLRDGFSSIALPTTENGDIQQAHGDINVSDSGFTQQEVDVMKKHGFRETLIDGSGDDPGTLLTADGTDVKDTEWGKRGLTEERWKQRRAFLDAEDSLSGLRAMEAQKGIVYAGQKNYFRDGDKLHEISADDKKTVMRGGEGAQTFLNNYKSKLKQDIAAEPPAESVSETASEPVTPADSASNPYQGIFLPTNNSNQGQSLTDGQLTKNSKKPEEAKWAIIR